MTAGACVCVRACVRVVFLILFFRICSFPENDMSQTLFMDKEGKLHSSLNSHCNLQPSRLRVANEGETEGNLRFVTQAPKTFAVRHKDALFLALTHTDETVFVSRYHEDKEPASSGGWSQITAALCSTSGLSTWTDNEQFTGG